MGVDIQEQWPHTWFVETQEIIDAVWHLHWEDDRPVVRARTVAGKLTETVMSMSPSDITDEFLGELEERMKGMRAFNHDAGDFDLVEPDMNARWSMYLFPAEDPDLRFNAPSPYYQTEDFGRLLGALTGYQPGYIIGTRLALIERGEQTWKLGVSQIRLKIVRQG